MIEERPNNAGIQPDYFVQRENVWDRFIKANFSSPGSALLLLSWRQHSSFNQAPMPSMQKLIEKFPSGVYQHSPK